MSIKDFFLIEIKIVAMVGGVLFNYFIKNNRLLRAERGNPVGKGGEVVKIPCVIVYRGLKYYSFISLISLSVKPVIFDITSIG